MAAMNISQATTRFTFLAQAMDGAGGFSPEVRFARDNGLNKPMAVYGECHLVPYPRESAAKFAARAACAVYENHLLQACERFMAFLSRKRPTRGGTESPLPGLMLDDADDAGNALDVFWHRFALQAKARGTMLLLVDMPAQRTDTTMAQTLAGTQTGAGRAVPYLVAIAPESVANFALNDRGLFTHVAIHSTAVLNGREEPVVRRWDETGWQVLRGEQAIAQGPHPFGQCPVLAFTENGGTFPQVGKYSQIADLSRRIYNASSELDEILRSQTFSLLTLQIPGDTPSPAEFAQAATATVGTHSMLVHSGQTPAFIAPDSGPAQVYMARIDKLERSIANIAMQSATDASGQAESGVARRMRFESLNADLASFSALMQDLEARMWGLFCRAMDLRPDAISVQWPTDYNLTDSAAELDVLALMQATGFPDAVQREKRRAIAAAEFDSSDGDTMAALMAAIDEPAQAAGGAAP